VLASMNRKPFVRAEEGSNNSVIYYDEDGNKLIRYWKSYDGELIEKASTRSWRNNNPGNHVMGNFAKRNGAIGEAGTVPGKKYKFTVYPDYTTGRMAQAKLLKEENKYIDLTLNEFVRKYTGVKSEEVDTQEAINYRKAIYFFTKFDMERTIRSLNDQEYEQLLDAMKKHEGWREGKEEYIEVQKILGVCFNKRRVISEFLIGNHQVRRWVQKLEAITLAENGKLDATVVHGKFGVYLRPRHQQLSFREMSCTKNEALAIV